MFCFLPLQVALQSEGKLFQNLDVSYNRRYINELGLILTIYGHEYSTILLKPLELLMYVLRFIVVQIACPVFCTAYLPTSRLSRW
jgi:hypothetical protein